ncbi:hypothetical protein [Alicyclobacillus vulcanalis]|uniref:Uncharacterized protein n=1 Tax=Alicyclobacillus vulcanalis TaxID=252246 RepID=A0A1N7KMH3_9BACL|nr:hypothetical protein [Alicyclobacillus vulcanalis]SIS62734.1 hypothetical protein SAMN05421799_10249 [Alicyclobacillus vulcanalis]
MSARHRWLSVAAVIAMLVPGVLAGCGRENEVHPAALVAQALPPTIADPPARVELAHYQMRNPHFEVQSHGSTVLRIWSDDHGWNGHRIDLYYAPAALVIAYHGDYTLKANTNLQRIASVPIRKNQTWFAAWNVGSYKLPDAFYVLAKTDVGQASIEKVVWQQGHYVEGGTDSPVQ